MGFNNCAQRFTGSNYLDVDRPLDEDIDYQDCEERCTNKFELMERTRSNIIRKGSVLTTMELGGVADS